MLRRLPSSSRFPPLSRTLSSRIARIGISAAAGIRPTGRKSWRHWREHQPSSLSPSRQQQHGSPALFSLRPFSSSAADDAAETVSIIGEEEGVSVEEQYSRKTPLEHVLLRPGMYVGPVERLPPVPCWVLDPTPPPPPSHAAAVDDQSLSAPTSTQEETATTTSTRMIRKEYGLVPALCKVFDEILVNASDNRLRHPKSCTRIDVIIDPGNADRDPFISVFNDGKGIPVQIHRKEHMYVPEMLFGHLLTGSNFDDSNKQVTGGRHGYGAKLTNIFSKSFTVETADAKKGKRYRQTWTNNMSNKTEPEITDMKPGEADYTCITFVPDLPKLTGISDASSVSLQDYEIMCRRVVDVAGCATGKLQVTLNGQDVSMSGFEEYSQLYRPPEAPPVCFHKVNSRWEVAIGLSSSGSLESISFVNGMATSRGGTHVNAIVQQVAKPIAERVAKLYPELQDTVTPGLVRRHLFVSCNTLIENPTFDSQMKESLTSNPTNFGCKYDLSAAFLNRLLKDEEKGGPGIVEELIRVAQGRQQANLMQKVGGAKATKRQLLSIPKLEDAHMAGTDSGPKCTLILTEGDSAKALAVAGLEVIGREHYGVFPLKGKFLNVREASVAKMTGNAEVKALCSILGLDFEKDYETQNERSGLRYGHVMLMTDQDTDGSHIKGLMMNFFRHFWPKLLQPVVDCPEGKPFLSSFVTPLLKVKRKGKKETKSFYSMAEYNEWRSSLEDTDEIKKWTVKYYKGLGTSTLAEAREYFKAFSDHHRPYQWHSDMDGELIDMVFDKKRAAERREWILEEYDEESDVTVDPDRDNAVTFEDFINNEMVHYSNADNVRSVPSVIDGLKPSQRKVLYACFKRKLKSEMKVAQLSGYCAEHTAYHHGEASLQKTITGMAQDFVGSNNINLLVPSGQFGTRLEGGTDAASPRYIFTHLSPVARHLFPEGDDVLLQYREDDGQLIEPEYYCPIIPLLLVNGSQGIGTGWSTFIPPHNPHDVLSYIRAKLDHQQELPPVRPWVRGFVGSIEEKENGDGFVTRGKAEKTSKSSVTITELPVGRWTDDYKSRLRQLCDTGVIQSFTDNGSTTSVSIVVNVRMAALSRMLKSGLYKKLKLETNLLMSNMHAFDANNTMQKFESAHDVANAYFPTRLALYHDRKSVLESEMNYSATVQRNKAGFISAVKEGRVDLIHGKKTKEETVKTLEELGFAKSTELKAIRNDNSVARRSEDLISPQESDDGDSGGPNTTNYDYLLNMPLSSLTAEKIQELQSEVSKTEEDLSEIRSTSPEDLWRADLDKLERHL